MKHKKINVQLVNTIISLETYIHMTYSLLNLNKYLISETLTL